MGGTRRTFVLSGMALAASWPAARGRAEAAAASYRVIVHESNEVAVVDRKFLADAFLKKITRWPGGGEVIRPVDLRPEAVIRGVFTDEILHRSVAAVKSYWQQLVFSGREVPPPEVDTDEQVIKYVLRFTGAVGYVSSNASTDRVKTLAVR